MTARINLHVATETWDYKVPFRVSRGAEAALDVIIVTLRDAQGLMGRGEAAGVDYDGETAVTLTAQIEAARPEIEAAVAKIVGMEGSGSDAAALGRTQDGRSGAMISNGRHDNASSATAPDCAALAEILPAGGARNAVDCALWDLASKRRRRSVWELAGLPHPRPLTTCITLGIDTDEAVAAGASRYQQWPLIKVKVDGDRHVEVIRRVHVICPTASLIVDPNQAWSCDLLNRVAAELASLGVVLVEQPVPRGEDDSLRNYTGKIRLAADESAKDRSSLPSIRALYQVVNIKLDKTGGLTEALAMAREVRGLGMSVMVGCMAGTSLAMAPGMVVGQVAEFLDLDGPLLHRRDREHGIQYDRGLMQLPMPALWGSVG